MKAAQRGGFVIGLVVGLLIGLAVALAVALYVTKAPVPFINKVPLRSAEQDAAEAERNKHWDPNAPLAGKNPVRPAATASGAVVTAPATAPATATTAAPAAAVGDASRSATAQPTGPAAAPAAIAARPASRSASAAVPVYFVQAGAYALPEDAEAQRAKLALLGLTARITEREQSGRTVYRVRLGPFDSREAAEDTQTRLAASSIEANLVRVER
jgi:cell division protein FtsN